jgi:hypothetical protein
VEFYYIFTADHFNEGDKVYVSQFGYDIPVNNLSAFRLVELSKENNAEALKNVLDNNKEMNFKPFVKVFSIYFDKQNMAKKKSAIIGTFVKASLVHTQAPDGKMILMMMYAIKPDRSVFHEEDAEYKSIPQLPVSYRLKDDYIYVNPYTVSSKELKMYSGQ